MYKPKQFTESFNRYMIGSAILVILTLGGGLGFVFFGLSIGYNLTSWHSYFGHNVVILTALVPFAFGLIGLFVVIKLLHKRSFRSLISNRYHIEHNISTHQPKINFSKIWFSFGLMACLLLVFYISDFLIRPQLFTWNFQAIPFLFLSLIGFVFIPIQAGLEELIFRGYLMQGFERLFINRRWLPLIITSFLFAGLHLPNPEIQVFGYAILGTYFFFGMIAGIISILDDGIELALGLHIANNLVTLLLINPNWAVLQTDALYTTKYKPALIEFYLSMLLIFGIYFLVLARKYQWKNWKAKLLGTPQDAFTK